MDDANPYAAPQFVAASTNAPVVADEAWRDGSLLVMHRGGALSNGCVKCNAAADGDRVKLRLAWHHPGWYALLLGYVPYLVAMAFVQRTATVEVGLCRRHRGRRAMLGVAAVLSLLLSIGLAVTGGLLVQIAEQEILAWIAISAILVPLVGSVVAIIGSRTVWPARISDDRVWLKGVCPEYLDELSDFHARLEPIASPPRSGAGM